MHDMINPWYYRKQYQASSSRHVIESLIQISRYYHTFNFTNQTVWLIQI